MAEEYCWVIRMVVRQFCCCQSGTTVLECEFQLDSVVYMYIVARVYYQF